MLARPTATALVVLVASVTALTTASCSNDAASVPTPTGSVVAVPETEPSPTESLLPSPTATTSVVGGLADGFPADLVTVPEGSEILVSTAETDATTGLLDISVNLRSPLSTDDLVQAIRTGLVAAGFTETVADPGSTGLSASSTFVRGDDGAELLTLGVLDRDGVRTLTLGGSVRTDG